MDRVPCYGCGASHDVEKRKLADLTVGLLRSLHRGGVAGELGVGGCIIDLAETHGFLLIGQIDSREIGVHRAQYVLFASQARNCSADAAERGLDSCYYGAATA